MRYLKKIFHYGMIVAYRIKVKLSATFFPQIHALLSLTVKLIICPFVLKIVSIDITITKTHLFFAINNSYCVHDPKTRSSPPDYVRYYRKYKEGNHIGRKVGKHKNNTWHI
jgi:hypothetical protein